MDLWTVFPCITMYIRRDEEIKGSATDYDEEVWYKTLNKAYYMETLVKTSQ